MATIIEFSMPPDEFPLGTVFETLPAVTVELEQLIPHEMPLVPYFWVRGAGAEEVVDGFAGTPDVVTVELVDSVEDECLMRANWAADYAGVLTAVAHAGVVVLAGVGRQDGWQFEVRGEQHQAVSEFRELCADRDIPMTITAVHALLPAQDDSYELTETQREALLLAYERGYFDSPRDASLEEIAEELGITQQSLSSRLRRGHRRLIEEVLVTA